MSQTPGELFLLEEYRAMQEAFLRNEELGERRVNLLFTLVGAVLAALTAGFLGEGRRTASAAGVVAFAALLLLGFSTLARVIQRNVRSSEYLRATAKIRGHFAAASPEIRAALTFGTDGRKPVRALQWRELKSFRNGGIVENVEIVNGLIAAGFGAAATLYFTANAWAVVAAVIGSFVSSQILQFAWVKGEYRRAADRLEDDWKKLSPQA